MGKGYRQGRLGEEIRRIISQMLLREINDPRLNGMVSITAVQVTSDGSYATVYLAGYGGEEEIDQEEILEAIRGAKGTFKREIGKQIKLRHIPELIFKIDSSLEYGRHIEEIIEKVVKKDEEQ